MKIKIECKSTDLQDEITKAYTTEHATDNAEIIRNSANDLETVLRTLNLAHYTCNGCDTLRYVDWVDRQMHVELTAVVRKLRRFQRLLSSGSCSYP